VQHAAQTLDAQQQKEQRSELFDLCRYLHRSSQMRMDHS
jgi:hypothetical protein